MKLLVFVWTLKSVVILGIIGLCILWLIILLIKAWFDSIFKKNCRKCKHCYLHSVAGYGGGTTYACDIKEKNRIIRTGIDNEYIKCSEFEKK